MKFKYRKLIIVLVFMLLAGLIVSGGKRVEHKFYYDDNVTLIEDSIQIYALEQEIAGVLDSSLLKQSLYIKTSLKKKYAFLPLRMKRVFSAEREKNKREYLKSDPSRKIPTYEPYDAFRFNLLIVENATGKIIVNNFRYDYLNYRVFNLQHSKMFRYLQMIDQGATIPDSFSFTGAYNSKNVSKIDLLEKLSYDLGIIRQAVSRSPYTPLHAKKWKFFARKLNLNEDLAPMPVSEYPDYGINTFFYLSTIDYLKTLAMIQSQKGIVEPRAVLQIANASGKQIYLNRNLSPKIVFSKDVMKKFKLLLSQSNIFQNNPIKMKEFKLIEDCFLRTIGRYYDENQTFYVNQKYSILISSRMTVKYGMYKYQLHLNRHKSKRFVYDILKELGHKQVPSKLEDLTGHWTGSDSKTNKLPPL